MFSVYRSVAFMCFVEHVVASSVCCGLHVDVLACGFHFDLLISCGGPWCLSLLVFRLLCAESVSSTIVEVLSLSVARFLVFVIFVCVLLAVFSPRVWGLFV